jgi:hypothetical protein
MEQYTELRGMVTYHHDDGFGWVASDPDMHKFWVPEHVMLMAELSKGDYIKFTWEYPQDPKLSPIVTMARKEKAGRYNPEQLRVTPEEFANRRPQVPEPEPESLHTVMQRRFTKIKNHATYVDDMGRGRVEYDEIEAGRRVSEILKHVRIGQEALKTRKF